MNIIKRVAEYARLVPKSIFFAVASLALLTVVAVASIETEINACVNNKTGSVRIINFLGGQCTKGETSLVWNKQGVQGLQGPVGLTGQQGLPGPVGPQGPAGPDLHLYDGSGQDLGILIDASLLGNGTYRTFSPTANVFLNFQTNHVSGIKIVRGIKEFNAYYLQSNCAGTAYIEFDTAQPQETTFITGINKMFKITDATIIIGNVPFSSQSVLNENGCQNTSLEIPALIPIEEISLPYTLPLAWPLTIK